MRNMENTEQAINQVIKKIDEMPYIFNSEADIQGLVYSELLKEYTEPYPTALLDSNRKIFLTNRVHREYFGGKGGRIDTVVFSKEEIGLIDIYWLCIKTSEHPGYRPVQLQDAIEIKIVGGKGEETLFAEIKKDIGRLTKLLKEKKTEKAHFILIIRWSTNNKSIKDRLDKAEKLAKELCEKNGIQFYYNKYKILFK